MKDNSRAQKSFQRVKVDPFCQHHKIGIKHVSGKVTIQVTFKTRGKKCMKITVNNWVVEELVLGTDENQ